MLEKEYIQVNRKFYNLSSIQYADSIINLESMIITNNDWINLLKKTKMQLQMLLKKCINGCINN